MLSKTRVLFEWLKAEKESREKEVAFLHSKKRELDDHIEYFTEILMNIDTFKEH